MAAFFYSKFNVKSIEILIFPAFGNLCFKANSYIYICILNFYTYFIDFGKKADGGGGSNCTVSYIYIYTIW